MNEPEVIVDMLGLATDPPEPRTIAVVGLSANPAKPSYAVPAAIQRYGYRILPVNPTLDPTVPILGELPHASLADLPVRPDVVNVFRLPQFIPGIVDEMIALGLRDLWVQLGLRDETSALRAENSNLRVVMDRCILIERSRLA